MPRENLRAVSKLKATKAKEPPVVPPIGEDAAQRKKILNVLAQRRYRHRKKEHVRQLESKLELCERDPSENMSVNGASTSASDAGVRALGIGAREAQVSPKLTEVTRKKDDQLIRSCQSEGSGEAMNRVNACMPLSEPQPEESIDPSLLLQDSSFSFPTPLSQDAAATAGSSEALDVELQFGWDESFDQIYNPSSPSPIQSQALPVVILNDSPQQQQQQRGLYSRTGFYANSNIATSSSTNNYIPFSSQLPGTLAGDGATVDATSGSSCSPPLSRPFIASSAPLNLSTALQQYQAKNQTFPDEDCLAIFELRLMRCLLDIARSLQIDHLMWSFESLSPFTDPALKNASWEHLPPNIRPTIAQRSVPHHPVLDLLPWPNTRSRLIRIFAQPAEMRPPVAASPMALLEFVYDIEDGADGVHIWGDQPFEGRNWEVGEKVFRKWWWAFDADILRQSNEWRLGRGAPLLGQGQVLANTAL